MARRQVQGALGSPAIRAGGQSSGPGRAAVAGLNSSLLRRSAAGVQLARRRLDHQFVGRPALAVGLGTGRGTLSQMSACASCAGKWKWVFWHKRLDNYESQVLHLSFRMPGVLRLGRRQILPQDQGVQSAEPVPLESTSCRRLGQVRDGWD